MNRQEALKNEHGARVERSRMCSALPPRDVCARPRRRGWLWLLLAALLVAAGLAGWFLCGGR